MTRLAGIALASLWLGLAAILLGQALAYATGWLYGAPGALPEAVWGLDVPSLDRG